MQNFIQLALEYIEHNLKTEITPEELAEMASYSPGHFCRLFAQAMDSTVASYILKRRLDHALQEIALGRKAIAVVYDYGFDTYAGFYKAFVKMYGCSPKKYLNTNKKPEVFMQREKDIRNILMNWDIPNDLQIKDASIRHWQTGETQWQIWQVGDEYYLKTSERSKMIKNIRIAKTMANEGLTSEFLPIPTKSGDDYFDGKHIFLLTKKVGEPLINEPLSDSEIAALDYHSNRANSAYKLGQAVAMLHRALKHVQDDIKPYEANLYTSATNSIPKVKEQSQKYNLGISEAFFADYTHTFGMLYDQLPKQLVHGNLTGDSIVFENGEIVGIKGYEVYNISHIRLFDIVYSAGETNTMPIESYIETLRAILAGYDSIDPLTHHEKQAVYYVLCSIGINMLAHCDETWDVSGRNRKALEFLAQNKELFVDLV